MNKDLEALETLKLLKDFVLENNKNGLDRRFIIGSCDILEKELKVLEIIKEKVKIEFNDHYFGIKCNYYIIVNNDVFGAIKVDKEQFDLLKEIML